MESNTCNHAWYSAYERRKTHRCPICHFWIQNETDEGDSIVGVKVCILEHGSLIVALQDENKELKERIEKIEAILQFEQKERIEKIEARQRSEAERNPSMSYEPCGCVVPIGLLCSCKFVKK